MNGNAWVNRLITGLFTAAAAWGSVTVQIKSTVASSVEALRVDIAHDTRNRVDSATVVMAIRLQRAMDTLSADAMRDHASHLRLAAAPTIHVTAPVDTMVAHRQDAMEATIGSINESLRNLAREMARQRAERDDWRALLDRKGYPRNPNVGGYGK
jgi:hypothetical protein